MFMLSLMGQMLGCVGCILVDAQMSRSLKNMQGDFQFSEKSRGFGFWAAKDFCQIVDSIILECVESKEKEQCLEST